MRAVQKMALSLLISVVAFSLFALFAYSGFFSLIESNFYDVRVRQQITGGLESMRSATDAYVKRYFERFTAIVAQNSIKRINIVNQSAQDIFDRKNLFDKLQADYPGVLSVRFVDAQGNIHFSTLPGDVLRQTNYETVYKTLAMADPHDPFARELESTSKSDAVYLDGSGRRLLFRLPWVDYLGAVTGSAVFAVSLADLQRYLVEAGVLDPGQSFAPVGNAGFLTGIDLAKIEKVGQEILKDWSTGRGIAGSGLPVAADSTGGKLFLFSVRSPAVGFFGEVVPQSVFSLNKALRLLLSASIFLTVYLLAFLLLSLRQDKLLVLADRIKRFQINFLKEYLESKSTLDWARWHSELEYRRNEVRREIKKGIGRLGKDREATVDGLIDKSWDEILTVIGKRVDEESVSAREVRGLEEAIRKLLASGDLAGALSRGIAAPAGAPRPSSPQEARARGGASEEGGEGAEAPALQKPTGPTEEAEPVEELEEVGAVEEAEPVEELEEAGAVEEAEPVEELEEVEEGDVAASDTPLPAEPAFAAPKGSESDTARERVVAVEEAEALDLEAIFHGDELVADIDVFDDMESELAPLVAADERSEEGPANAADREIPAEYRETARPPARGDADPSSTEVEELEEFPEELEEVEPLEVTHPEIARVDEKQGEEEVEEIEFLPAAETGEETDMTRTGIGTAEATLQTASYGFALFMEFQGRRVPTFGTSARLDSIGELEEVEERESMMSEESQKAPGDGGRGEGRSPRDERDEVETGTEGRGARAGKLEEVEPAEELEEVEPAEELEEVEPAEELESGDGVSAPVEELAELEEVDDQAAVSPPSAAVKRPESRSTEEQAISAALQRGRGLTSTEARFERQIRLLITAKKIEIYSLSDVKSMGLVPEEAIEVSDGVYKIKEEVVARTARGKDEKLRSLVDSVVSSGGEEQGASAIGQLLSIPTVELSFGNMEDGSQQSAAGKREQSAPRRLSRRPGGRIMLTERGFDYDSFRSEFKSSYMGTMKSLMRISQKADAIYAAILVPKDGGLVAEYTVGLDDSSAYNLKFDRADAVLRNLLARRELLYLRTATTGVAEFDGKIASRDQRFMAGTIYLPVVFDGSQGYLFFGLKDCERSIQEFMLPLLEQ